MKPKKYGISYKCSWDEEYKPLVSYTYTNKQEAEEQCKKFNMVTSFFQHIVVEINTV